MKIIQDNLPKNQYYDETQIKRIIVLHHTAGGTAASSIDWWRNTTEKVATTVVIDRNGIVLQAFPFDKWGSALGIRQSIFDKYKLPNINKRLDQISIQIEIANWGELQKKGDKYYTYTGREIEFENVQTYNKPFRGSLYYEKYTEKQINTLKELIINLNKLYPEIKLNYNEDMWDVSTRALRGYWGIWTHTSFRPDKNDCHPQPELINMLKSLK